MRAFPRSLLFAVAIAALAGRAAAEDGDLPKIERALSDIYALTPRDLAGSLADLEAIQPRRPRDARVEAGIAMALAIRAEAGGNAEAALDAARRARSASAASQARAVARALGVTSVVAAHFEKAHVDRQSRLETAERAFAEAARDESPERWLDQYRRGLVLSEMGRTGLAVEALRAAAEAAPPEGAAAVRLALGQALSEGGRLREAIEVLGPSSSGMPTATAIAIADALDRLGEPRRALEALAGVEGDAAARERARLRAELGETDAWRAAPAEDARAHALSAELRRLAGDLDGAAAEFREAIRMSSLVSLAHAGLAELALARNETPTAAIVRARAAALLEPRNPARWGLLARAYRAAGEAALAEDAERRRAKLEGALSAARAKGLEIEAATAVRAAAARLSAGRPEEALERLAPLGEPDPEDGEALVLRLEALLARGPERGAEARALAAMLVSRLEDLHDIHGLAAAAADLAGDSASAQAAAKRAIALEPTDARARGVLARQLAAATRPEPKPGAESPMAPGPEPRRGFRAPDLRILLLGLVSLILAGVSLRLRRRRAAPPGAPAPAGAAPGPLETRAARRRHRAEQEEAPVPASKLQGVAAVFLVAATIASAVHMVGIFRPKAGVDARIATRAGGAPIPVYKRRGTDEVIAKISPGTVIYLGPEIGKPPPGARLPVRIPQPDGKDIVGFVAESDLDLSQVEKVRAKRAALAAESAPKR